MESSRFGIEARLNSHRLGNFGCINVSHRFVGLNNLGVMLIT